MKKKLENLKLKPKELTTQSETNHRKLTNELSDTNHSEKGQTFCRYSPRTNEGSDYCEPKSLLLFCIFNYFR